MVPPHPPPLLPLLLLLLLDTAAAVEFGVWFREWPRWEVAGVPGSPVTFPCTTNVTADKISWQYNHHFLLSPADPTAATPTPYHVREVGQEEGGGSELVVTLARREAGYKQQLGLYQCVAWFGAVALTSLPGRLRAALLESYPEVGVEVEVEVVEGEAVRVECGLPHSVPEAQLTFYRDGQPLDLHGDTVYRLTPHGDLVIVGVGGWAAGRYSCSAHNPALNSSVTRRSGTVVKVAALGGDRDTSPPQFVTLHSVYSGITGSNVTLMCLANGNPRPRMSWSKYGGTLPTSSVQTEEGSLIIVDVAVEDEGTYLCHAENGVGATEAVLDMMLEVLDPPRLVEGPTSQEVEEGQSAALTCSAQGHPPPKVMWVFNGRLVRNDGNILITENGLSIATVEKEHAGIFQCFVHNPQGTVQQLAMISVVPRLVTVVLNGTLDHHGSETTDGRRWSGEQGADDETERHETEQQGTNEAERSSRRNGKGRNRGVGRRKGVKNVEAAGGPSTGGRRRKGKRKKGRMIPPSKPRVAKVSDESVMVTWDGPEASGIPMVFYKIQYKVVPLRGRTSQWMTVDEYIPPHIHSFEVTGLRTGRTYRFRLAAAYSNDDNMMGPTSRRFLLEKSHQVRRPATPPTISSLLPRGPTTITLAWQYQPAPGVPVEGFFINYREATMARDYTKVTVLDPNKRSFVIDYLKANVSYDFKMQVFNLAGASDFSSIYKKIVAGPVTSTTEEPIKEGAEMEESLVPVVRSGDPAVSNLQLYIILGAVLGLLLLIVVVSAAVYSCRNSHANDDTRSVKYEDTSLHIHRETSTYSLPEDHRNTNGRRHNGYLPHQGITITARENEKVVMGSSLIENNNHNSQPLERCYTSPARRIATEDSRELKNVPLVRNSCNNFDVGTRELSTRT